MQITIHLPSPDVAEGELDAWQRVYADFSDRDIAEIEAIALDRSHFMARER